jgi:hypothetical protein
MGYAGVVPAEAQLVSFSSLIDIAVAIDSCAVDRLPLRGGDSQETLKRGERDKARDSHVLRRTYRILALRLAVKLYRGVAALLRAAISTKQTRRDGFADDQPAALSLSATIFQYCMLLDRLRQHRFTNNEEEA